MGFLVGLYITIHPPPPPPPPHTHTFIIIIIINIIIIQSHTFTAEYCAIGNLVK